MSILCLWCLSFLFFAVNGASILGQSASSGEKIIHHEDQLSSDGHSGNGIHRRAAIKDESKRWTHGIVPYEYDNSFSYSDRRIVEEAMREWSAHTCVTFRPARYEDLSSVKFVHGNRDECHSDIGMLHRDQNIILGPGCRNLPTVLHQIGHALGLIHTDERPDRDSHVLVPDNLHKKSWYDVHDYGVDFDYESIMLPSNKGGYIRTHDPGWQHIIGNAEHLSFGDIKLVNAIYTCAKTCILKDSDCFGNSFVDEHCGCVCPGPSNNDPVVDCPSTGTMRTNNDDYYYNNPNIDDPDVYNNPYNGESDDYYNDDNPYFYNNPYTGDNDDDPYFYNSPYTGDNDDHPFFYNSPYTGDNDDDPFFYNNPYTGDNDDDPHFYNSPYTGDNDDDPYFYNSPYTGESDDYYNDPNVEGPYAYNHRYKRDLGDYYSGPQVDDQYVYNNPYDGAPDVYHTEPQIDDQYVYNNPYYGVPDEYHTEPQIDDQYIYNNPYNGDVDY